MTEKSITGGEFECVQKMHELESPDVVNSSDTINGVPSVLFMARNSDGEMFNYGFNSTCVRTYHYVLKEDQVEICSAELKQKIGDLLGEQWGGNILQRNQMAIDFTVDYMLSRNLIAQAAPELPPRPQAIDNGGC